MTANQNLNQINDTVGASKSAPQDFVERVKQAVQNMKADGIELWRPTVDEELEDIFQVAIVGESVGCTNQQCNHNSHDPSSPKIKLIPKQGKLVYLGELEQGENTFYYYALLTPNGTKYFQVVNEEFFWHRIYEIEPIGVPDFLLVKFAKGE